MPFLPPRFSQDFFTPTPGGINQGGPVSPGSSGININLPPSGGGSGSINIGGKIGATIGSAASGALSSVLGIPAINWGRIAAFLLGLLLIAFGLYLWKPVQQTVTVVTRGARKAGAAISEASEAA